MNCPTCHQEIPDNYKGHIPRLLCPQCTAMKSYQSVLAFQKQFVARILSGEAQVTTAKIHDFDKPHILFVGFKQAWCSALPDKDKNQSWKSKRRLPYPEIKAACEHCRTVLEQLAEAKEVA